MWARSLRGQRGRKETSNVKTTVEVGAGGGEVVVVGGGGNLGSLEGELGLGLGFGGGHHVLDVLEGLATLAVALPGVVIDGALGGTAGHLGVDGAIGGGVTSGGAHLARVGGDIVEHGGDT